MSTRRKGTHRAAPRRKTSPHKPTKLEALTESVAQDYAHQNSQIIHSRKRVLEFEAEEADKSIIATAGALAAVRERRAKIQALLVGLENVIRKR